MSTATKTRYPARRFGRLENLADRIEGDLLCALMAPEQFVDECVRKRLRAARERAIDLRAQLVEARCGQA